jgi:hypothetical protein
MNNASLIQYRAYNIGTEEFTALFKACDQSWAKFFAVLSPLEDGKAFASEHMQDLTSVLTPLTKSGCKPSL